MGDGGIGAMVLRPVLCHSFAGALDAGEGVAGGRADGAGGGAPGDDAVFDFHRRDRRGRRWGEAHGEVAFFAVADLPCGVGEMGARVVEDCFVGEGWDLAVGDEPSVFDEGGVWVEGKDVVEADAVGTGGLEIHEGHGFGIEVGFGGMEFESAEDLAPRGVVVLRWAAVEGPSGSDLLSVGEMEGGVVGVVLEGVDGDTAEESDVGGDGEFCQRHIIEPV